MTRLKFIPENLDLNEILKATPPDFKYNIDCFLHILSLITELPAKKKRLLDLTTFVPINASILKKSVYNYKDYLKYLVENNIFESDNYYIPKQKSFGFRFTAQYQTFIKPVEISRYTLIKSITAETNYERNMRRKYYHLSHFFDDRLEFNFEAAQDWLLKKYRTDVESGVIGALQIYNANLLNALKLRDREYYFKVDSTSGRLHTNLTSLNGKLRNCLTFEEKTLINNDISTSQPVLATLLLNERFYQKDASGDLLNIHKIAPALAKILNISSILKTIENGQPDIERYKNALTGDLYLSIGVMLKEQMGLIIEKRRELKDIVFSVLYSDNRFISQPEAEPKRLFRDMFGSVYKIFKIIKTGNPATLPILLQTIESRLVLDVIVKRIQVEKPSEPIFTLHDSILCTEGNEEYCESVMIEVTEKHIGFRPKVKPEILSLSELCKEAS